MNPFLRALVAAGLLDQDTADRMSRALSPAEAQAYAEQQVAAAFQQGLSGQLGRLTGVLRANEYNLSPAEIERFWASENRILAEDVIPVLTDTATEAAISAAMRGGGFTMWNAVNERVIGWVEDYYINPDAAAFGSVPNLNQTAKTIVGNAFNAWQRGELEVAANAEGLPRLILALEPAFGPQRARLIAATEATRIYSESERAAGEADPNTVAYRFLSAADELVCPQCGPLHGRIVGKSDRAGFIHPTLGAIGYPPIHPGCRCTITPESSATVDVPLGAGGAELWEYTGPEARGASRGNRNQG